MRTSSALLPPAPLLCPQCVARSTAFSIHVASPGAAAVYDRVRPMHRGATRLYLVAALLPRASVAVRANPVAHAAAPNRFRGALRGDPPPLKSWPYDCRGKARGWVISTRTFVAGAGRNTV